MSPVRRGIILHEASAVLGELSGDGAADALRVAIYLEDALDITLPDDVITPAHLGTAAAIARTVDRYAELI